MRAGFHRQQRGVSLIEALVALAIMSALLLPIGMFLLEYSRGSTQLGDFNQVLNLLEERMEMALAQPFSQLPLGESSDKLIPRAGDNQGIDLRTAQVGKEKVTFSLRVEMVPVEFAAAVDAENGRIDRIRLEESYKRITITAAWGTDKPRSLDLAAYKADL